MLGQGRLQLTSPLQGGVIPGLFGQRHGLAGHLVCLLRHPQRLIHPRQVVRILVIGLDLNAVLQRLSRRRSVSRFELGPAQRIENLRTRGLFRHRALGQHTASADPDGHTSVAADKIA